MQPRPWREHLPPGSAFRVEDLVAHGSLPAAWASRWASAPDAPMVLEAAGDGAWCSAAHLDDMTRALAERLRQLGIEAGQRVVWSTGSSLAAVAVNVAALRAGVVVVPVNPAYTDRELAHIVEDVRPVAAIVDDPARAARLAAIGGGILVTTCDLEVVVPPARPSPPPAGAAGSTDEIVLDGAGPEAPALIAYTSGTTGAPKGAVLRHGNLLANSASVALAWRWRDDDRLIHALPVFHGHGLCVALYTSLLVGASAVLLPRFDPDAVLEASVAHRASLFFGVPTMYHRLAAAPGAPGLGRLRLLVSGSAPLPAELHHRMRAVTGSVVLERYGMTETLMTLSNPCQGERRPGTVGFPFPGVEARVEEAEGEILVKGPALFAGYWQRPAATEAAFTGDWFRTGDLATVEDGYVRILGRSSDMIISGGFNVYPAEVEDVLLGHPSVAEVAVTGTTSDEWGEIVTAWVVADGIAPLDPGAVMAFAAERLAPYKCPRRVCLVDALPRNAMGKVQKSDLH